MKAFISYHRADTEYRKKLENILNANHIEFYAVPEDADFNGKKNEAIRNFTCNKVKKCSVLICLIGNGTYRRPHVDREIHTALKGGVDKRLGIIAIYLPTRSDTLKNPDFRTLPQKLVDNDRYVVWDYWDNLKTQIRNLLKLAENNSKDSTIQTDHSNPCLPIKNKVYYDN